MNIDTKLNELNQIRNARCKLLASEAHLAKVTNEQRPLATIDVVLKEEDGMTITFVKQDWLEGLGFDYKKIYKTSKGDKYDSSIGVILAIFELSTNLTYQDVRRVFDSFMKTTNKVDPAMAFITKYVEGCFASKEEINKLIKEFGTPTKDGGVHVLVELMDVVKKED